MGKCLLDEKRITTLCTTNLSTSVHWVISQMAVEWVMIPVVFYTTGKRDRFTEVKTEMCCFRKEVRVSEMLQELKADSLGVMRDSEIEDDKSVFWFKDPTIQPFETVNAGKYVEFAAVINKKK